MAARNVPYWLALAVLALAFVFLSAGCRMPAIPTPAPTVRAPTATALAPTPTLTPQAQPTAVATQPATSVPSATAVARQGPSGTLEVILPGLGNGKWTRLFPGPADIRQHMDPVYNYLFSPSPDWPVTGKYQGELVETWEVSADGRQLRMRLRKGVTFHKNYGELTAVDVKFSFEQYSSGDVVEGAADLGRDLEAFEIVNPYELVMRFKQPHPTIISELSSESGDWAILSKKYVESVGKEKADQVPVGTGQYQLLEQTAAYVVVEAAPGTHFLGTPDFRQIRFRAVPDEITRVALLRAGEADIVPIGRVSIPAVKSIPGAKVMEMPYYTLIEVSLGGLQFQGGSQFDPNLARKDPWADVRVRQAMNLAIDRQGIIDGLFAGHGRPAAAPAILRGWEKLPAIPHDIAKAKALLKDAGFEKGFPIRLQSFALAGVGEMPKVLEAVAWMWQQAGIQSKIEAVDPATFRSIATSGKTAGLAYPRQSGQKPDMERLINRTYFGKSATQVIYQDQTVFDILQAWTSSADPAIRLASEQRLGAYLHDQSATIPIAMMPSVAGLSSKVAGWPNPINETNPRGYAAIKAAR